MASPWQFIPTDILDEVKRKAEAEAWALKQRTELAAQWAEEQRKNISDWYEKNLQTGSTKSYIHNQQNPEPDLPMDYNSRIQRGELSGPVQPPQDYNSKIERGEVAGPPSSIDTSAGDQGALINQAMRSPEQIQSMQDEKTLGGVPSAVSNTLSAADKKWQESVLRVGNALGGQDNSNLGAQVKRNWTSIVPEGTPRGIAGLAGEALSQAVLNPALLEGQQAAALTGNTGLQNAYEQNLAEKRNALQKFEQWKTEQENPLVEAAGGLSNPAGWVGPRGLNAVAGQVKAVSPLARAIMQGAITPEVKSILEATPKAAEALKAAEQEAKIVTQHEQSIQNAAQPVKDAANRLATGEQGGANLGDIVGKQPTTTGNVTVYTGSDTPFTKFDVSKIGTRTDPGFAGRGAYTTTNFDTASKWGSHVLQTEVPPDAKLLSISNISELYSKYGFQPLTPTELKLPQSEIRKIYAAKSNEFAKKMQDTGYDGVKWALSNGDTQYALFDPEKYTFLPAIKPDLTNQNLIKENAGLVKQGAEVSSQLPVSTVAENLPANESFTTDTAKQLEASMWKAQQDLNAARQSSNASEVARLDGVINDLRDQYTKINPQSGSVPAATKRYYHGTGSVFDAPEAGKFDPDGLYGPGYYMTDNPEVSGSYAKERYDQLSGTDMERFNVAWRQQQDKLRSLLDEHITNAGKNADPTYIGYLKHDIERIAGYIRRNEEQNRKSLLAGANIRPIDVPEGLKLLDVGHEYQRDVTISDMQKRLDDLWRSAKGTDYEGLPEPQAFREAVADDGSHLLSGERIWIGVVNAFDGNRQDATQFLNQFYDGIKYQGGNIMPLKDAAGNAIQHEAVVIFPESLSKITNALSKTQGGFTTPGAALHLGGASAGAASQDDPNLPAPERALKDITGAAVGAAGVNAVSRIGSRLLSTPALRIPNSLNWLPDIPSNTRILSEAYKPDAVRRIVDKFDNPITNDIAAKAGIPKNDIFMQAQILHETVQSEWKAGIVGAIARLNVLGKSEDIFNIGKDGRAVIDGVPVAARDMAEYPGRYNLNTQQKHWIQTAYKLLDDMSERLDAAGVDVKKLEMELGGHWFPTNVLGKMDPATGEMILAQVGGSGQRVGALAAFEKHRVFVNSQEEALKLGFKYMTLEDSLHTALQAAGRKIADQRMLDNILPQLSRVRTTAVGPGALQTARDLAVQKWGVFQDARLVINRGYRGERVPMQTINKIGRFFPDVADVLRDAKITKQESPLLNPIGRDKLQIAEAMIKDRSSTSIWAALKTEVKDAKYAYTSMKNATKGTQFGEAIVQAPAFAGKFFSAEDAKKLEAIMDINQPPGLLKTIRGGADAVSAVNAVPRLMQTTYDIGTPFIQGLPMLFFRPKEWTKATSVSMESFLSELAQSSYYADNADVMRDMAQHGVYMLPSEQTAAMNPGTNVARLIEGVEKKLKKVPYVGGGLNLTTRSVRAYETFLNAARIEGWKATRSLAHSEEDLFGLGKFLNDMTGQVDTATKGISPTQRSVETAALYAPRYLRATISLATSIARKDIRGEQARAALFNMVAVGGLGYIGISYGLGQTPHLDPRDRLFLTVNIGGQDVGFGGSFVSLSKMALSTMLDPGKAHEYAWKYISGKASPLASTTIGLASYPYNYDSPLDLTKNVIAKNMIPFWLQSLLLQEHTSPEAAIIGLGAEALGGRAVQPTKPVVSKGITYRGSAINAGAYKGSSTIIKPYSPARR